MKTDEWIFLNNEILTLTILGGLTRGVLVYKPSVLEIEKREFRKTLKKELEEYASFYKVTVNTEQHIKNIEKFADKISQEYRAILSGNRLRIGRAQKVLNLYLKYLWALGRIPEPPHCPFDAIVIRELKLGINFTKLDSISDYKLLVEAAKKISGEKNLSIAKWELRLWNRVI